MDRLIVFGAGGHAKVALEAVLASFPDCAITVLDDDPGAVHRPPLGMPLPGGRDWLRDHWPDAPVFPAVGNNAARAELIDWLVRSGREIAGVIHPRALLSPSATLGPGGLLAPGAIIDAETVLDAGAAVTRDVPDGARVGGVPARRLSSGR